MVALVGWEVFELRALRTAQSTASGYVCLELVRCRSGHVSLVVQTLAVAAGVAKEAPGVVLAVRCLASQSDHAMPRRTHGWQCTASESYVAVPKRYKRPTLERLCAGSWCDETGGGSPPGLSLDISRSTPKFPYFCFRSRPAASQQIASGSNTGAQKAAAHLASHNLSCFFFCECCAL